MSASLQSKRAGLAKNHPAFQGEELEETRPDAWPIGSRLQVDRGRGSNYSRETARRAGWRWYCLVHTIAALNGGIGKPNVQVDSRQRTQHYEGNRIPLSWRGREMRRVPQQFVHASASASRISAFSAINQTAYLSSFHVNSRRLCLIAKIEGLWG